VIGRNGADWTSASVYLPYAKDKEDEMANGNSQKSQSDADDDDAIEGRIKSADVVKSGLG
jgi:hypothetical protein